MKFSQKIKNNLLEMDEYLLPQNNGKRFSMPKIHYAIRRQKGKVDFDIFDQEMIQNDSKTNELIRSGNTIGCFYIESPGMRSLLRRLDCHTFEMLVAASSIIRPGVAESGMMKEFIERHQDPSKRKYLNAEIKDLLSETYGVMVYQEDVMKVINKIGGLTLEEADLLRRAMSGKMRSHKSMQRLIDKFFASCREKNYPEKTTLQLWHQIESFAGYAFNKAHSASFAIVSYQVAYLKTHFPEKFMASVLNNQGGYYSAAVYIQECRRMGLKILLPDINRSKYEYVGIDGCLQVGFLAIKTLSKILSRKIIKERDYNGRYVSLIDFLIRIKPNVKEAELLIKCGAMDSLNSTRPTLMRLLDIYLLQRKIFDEENQDLFAFESYKLEMEVATEFQYPISRICKIEYETFGYMITRHPLEFFSKTINRKDIIKASDMAKYNGQKIKIVGWFMASKRIKTKKGEIMKFLSLEDLTGTFEAVLFPNVYKHFAEKTLTMGPYLLEGKADIENGFNLIVENLIVLSAKELAATTQKDSSEKKYYGEVEKISEEEFHIVASLGKVNLQLAYAS
ncbi:MAG: hypothetical protein KKF62_09870 [Bacteroidetes bacterium]|nr:hypothetical protein [Bacteroidota bacterium]MBU1116576.1 hypothetical protein [Bacteroidota bacterium]MBU1797202.1 hypothetical protein [Bacteroidota bacterium]